MQPGITFRPLQESDLALLHRWLNLPHVMQWWDKDGATPDEIRSKYLPRIAGASPVFCFIIDNDNADVGCIQAYWVNDFPESFVEIASQPTEKLASLDVFIGEPELLNSGLGSTAVRKFLDQIVFSKMSAKSCIVAPAANNRAAIRAYEKAGFAMITNPALVGAVPHSYLMSCPNQTA